MNIRVILKIGSQMIEGTISSDSQIFTADDGRVFQPEFRYVLNPTNLSDYTPAELLWIRQYIYQHELDSPPWRFSLSWFNPIPE